MLADILWVRGTKKKIPLNPRAKRNERNAGGAAAALHLREPSTGAAAGSAGGEG